MYLPFAMPNISNIEDFRNFSKINFEIFLNFDVRHKNLHATIVISN
jgi:hypothetical protein